MKGHKTMGIVLVLIVFISISEWKRGHYRYGLFRDRPNSSVAVLSYPSKARKINADKSIWIDGRNDCFTVDDYVSIAATSLIPYLSTDKEDKNVTLIGIGSGTVASAGIFSQYERVKSLDVIGISP